MDDTTLGKIADVPLTVSAVLGTATLRVKQLMKLGRGAVIQLDKEAGDLLDIYVNNRLIARGEITVVDGRVAITLAEIHKLPKAPAA